MRGEREILTLGYHAVSESWPSALAVKPDALDRQLRWFLQRGFRPATFGEAVTNPTREARTLVVTFDDAYRSVVQLAFPILRRLGIPATVFAPTAWGDGATPMSWPGIDHWVGTAWESELIGASWKELRELVNAGWEIGSHTRSHPHLTELDDAKLADELQESRADCEANVGAPCRSLAYPYGQVDDRVAEAARRAGYAVAATLSQPTHAARVRHDVMRWPRLGVYRSDGPTRLRIKVRLFRSSPRAWDLALAARGRAGAFRTRTRAPKV